MAAQHRAHSVNHWDAQDSSVCKIQAGFEGDMTEFLVFDKHIHSACLCCKCQKFSPSQLTPMYIDRRLTCGGSIRMKATSGCVPCSDLVLMLLSCFWIRREIGNYMWLKLKLSVNCINKYIGATIEVIKCVFHENLNSELLFPCKRKGQYF